MDEEEMNTIMKEHYLKSIDSSPPKFRNLKHGYYVSYDKKIGGKTLSQLPVSEHFADIDSARLELEVIRKHIPEAMITEYRRYI
jgi:hypothetical protein